MTVTQTIPPTNMVMLVCDHCHKIIEGGGEVVTLACLDSPVMSFTTVKHLHDGECFLLYVKERYYSDVWFNTFVDIVDPEEQTPDPALEEYYGIHPAAAGELLRAKFFVEHDNEYGPYGCYDTFVPPPDAVPLSFQEQWYFWESAYGPYDHYGEFITLKADIEHLGKGYSFTIGHTKCYCLWYWDGDGVLLFVLPKRAVVNYDCKKSYCWEEVKSNAGNLSAI